MDDFINKILNDPYIIFLGISVDKFEKGYSQCSIIIKNNMLNFNGLVHGGLIFSLADVAFSIASNSDHLPSYALDVSGSFLKTANVGDRVIAEAKLIHTTKRTGLYRMEVSRNNELIATFNGTVFRKVD
jgi:acyl-CoA thioesterase